MWPDVTSSLVGEISPLAEFAPARTRRGVFSICMSPSISPNDAEFERRLAVTGPVTLDISLDTGRVRVRRGDADSVVIRGAVRVHSFLLSFSDPQRQAQEIATDPPIFQEGNHIQMGDLEDRWLLSHTELQLEILTPADTRVRAFGDSADLRVEGVHGPVYCETDSGQIQIAHIESEVSAACDSGAISISNAAGPVDAATDSGAIEALEIAGRIDARCDSGEISISQTVAAPIHARTDSGSIRVKLAEGGYRLRLLTDSGRVEIPEAAQAQAWGKEIEVSIRGGGPIVDLATDSGGIQVS
jgi:hypothetical protein